MIVVLDDGDAAELARTLAAGAQARIGRGETVGQGVTAIVRVLDRAARGQLRAARGQSDPSGSAALHDGGVRRAMNLIDAAAHLGVSTRTVRRRVHEGRLTARREGRRLVFDREALDRYRQETAT